MLYRSSYSTTLGRFNSRRLGRRNFKEELATGEKAAREEVASNKAAGNKAAISVLGGV